MADIKKKKNLTLFTHWARPRVRTYQYNFEYGESYYRPLVQYISTSRAMSSSSVTASSSSSSYETSRMKMERRRRAASPPGALSFIERWAHEPFYGYGIGFRSRLSSDRSYSSAYQSSASQESSRSLRSHSVAAMESSASQAYSRSLRARSVAAMRQSSAALSAETDYRSERARSVAAMRQSSAALSAENDYRSERARSLEAAYRYASDDCLMRSTALSSARSARAASEDIMNTRSLTNKTLVLDNQNVLHGRTLDERCYLDYPKQHLVCDDNCPLHNSPEWRRRFLIGNRFLDAAALGGFDVLYDPSVYKNSRRLLSKLAERSESESDEIIIQRSSESDSSRRRIRATSYFA